MSGKRKRKYIYGATRRKLWEKLGKGCVRCGAETALFRGSPYSDPPVAHLDHIVPFSKGGRCSEKNMQVLCESCNCSKGAKLEMV